MHLLYIIDFDRFPRIIARQEFYRFNPTGIAVFWLFPWFTVVVLTRVCGTEINIKGGLLEAIHIPSIICIRLRSSMHTNYVTSCGSHLLN